MCHITASNNIVIFREFLQQKKRFSMHKYYFQIHEFSQNDAGRFRYKASLCNDL